MALRGLELLLHLMCHLVPLSHLDLKFRTVLQGLELLWDLTYHSDR